MSNQRTMVELLHAPTEGYVEPIVVPPIPAKLFRLQHSFLRVRVQHPSNTVANPRGDLKAYLTTRSGISYDGPLIPPPFSSLPKLVERETEVTKDMVQPSTKNIQPPVVQIQAPIDECLIDVYGEELTLRVDDEAITFKVGQTLRYSYNDVVSINRIDITFLSTSSPSLTPFEEVTSILGKKSKLLSYNDSIPLELMMTYFDPEGDLLLLENLLNNDPSTPLLPKELHVEELKIIKSSIDDPLDPELELKDLPSHLEYLFLEGTYKLPVIIAKDLKVERPWVSPIHCVPKKVSITIIENDDNDLIPTRLVTGWHVCIDYQKLNDATRKDHFQLSFMDQMLERLAGNEYYCFLDGFSGYFQIHIDPTKTMRRPHITCPLWKSLPTDVMLSACVMSGMFPKEHDGHFHA
ncbi:hypothetical protein Tco_0233081 [Tanacetum coccineum]